MHTTVQWYWPSNQSAERIKKNNKPSGHVDEVRNFSNFHSVFFFVSLLICDLLFYLFICLAVLCVCFFAMEFKWENSYRFRAWLADGVNHMQECCTLCFVCWFFFHRFLLLTIQSKLIKLRICGKNAIRTHSVWPFFRAFVRKCDKNKCRITLFLCISLAVLHAIVASVEFICEIAANDEKIRVRIHTHTHTFETVYKWKQNMEYIFNATKLWLRTK